MFNKNKSTSNSYKEKNEPANNSTHFFIGILLLASGLFMLSKRIVVHSNWYVWRFGDFSFSSGTITIPFIIGIIWYFYNPKSILSKIIIILSIIFMILSIIMSIRISFITTSMFDYLLMFGMASAGSGLLLKTFFNNKKE